MPSSGRLTLKLSVGATPVSLPTEVDGDPVVRAFLTVETAAIRFLYTGQTPTDEFGHRVDTGQDATVETPANIAHFLMVADTATPADVTVTVETF